ncbi:MAG: hypothetical protein SFV17_04515 [Candidatus Obscuribacter sp.]|nr:hypothetical protein [Candidatus Obscuribacter sp.]
MNQTNSVTSINESNAARVLSNLHDQISLLQFIASMYADLREEDDIPSVRFLTAGLYTGNAVLALARDCADLVESGFYTAAAPLVDLVNSYFDIVQARLEDYKSRDPEDISEAEAALVANPPVLLEQLQGVKNLVATLDARVQMRELAAGIGEQLPATAPVGRLLAALKHAVREAEESVHIGMGNPQLIFTDEKIASVVQGLISQIISGGQAEDEASALVMVDGVLGATMDDKRNFLLSDIYESGRVGSRNVQAGVALSARVELALATAVAVVLDKQLGTATQDAVAVPATETAATEEVDPVTAMLLQAEANLGKPIVVEKDGLLG